MARGARVRTRYDVDRSWLTFVTSSSVRRIAERAPVARRSTPSSSRCVARARHRATGRRSPSPPAVAAHDPPMPPDATSASPALRNTASASLRLACAAPTPCGVDEARWSSAAAAVGSRHDALLEPLPNCSAAAASKSMSPLKRPQASESAPVAYSSSRAASRRSRLGPTTASSSDVTSPSLSGFGSPAGTRTPSRSTVGSSAGHPDDEVAVQVRTPPAAGDVEAAAPAARRSATSSTSVAVRRCRWTCLRRQPAV